jgi:hypothetical protein
VRGRVGAAGEAVGSGRLDGMPAGRVEICLPRVAAWQVAVLDRFDRCGILMILIYALQCGQSSSSVQIDKLLWSGESQFF